MHTLPQKLLINNQHLLGNSVHAAWGPNAITKLGQQSWLFSATENGLAPALHRIWLDEESINTIAYRLGDSPDIGAEHRHSRCKRFQHYQRTSFQPPRRNGNEMIRAQQWNDLHVPYRRVKYNTRIIPSQTLELSFVC